MNFGLTPSLFFQLLALVQLLPSKDEALTIRSYLPPDEIERDEAIAKLGECEKYMTAMLGVENASGKFRCMIYRVQFNNMVDRLASDIKILLEAVSCVRNSDRLTRLMLFALRLGNMLNTGGGGNDVSAITLDSLLKLQEVRDIARHVLLLHAYSILTCLILCS